MPRRFHAQQWPHPRSGTLSLRHLPGCLFGETQADTLQVSFITVLPPLGGGVTVSPMASLPRDYNWPSFLVFRASPPSSCLSPSSLSSPLSSPLFLPLCLFFSPVFLPLPSHSLSHFVSFPSHTPPFFLFLLPPPPFSGALWACLQSGGGGAPASPSCPIRLSCPLLFGTWRRTLTRQCHRSHGGGRRQLVGKRLGTDQLLAQHAAPTLQLPVTWVGH